jgi:hypothetical protein
MLRFVRDDVTAGRGWTTGETEHGEIARFGSTTCENQFVRFYAQQPGQLVTRVIDGRARLSPSCMHAGWISEEPVEIRQHCLTRRVTQRRRCVVVEVNHSVFLLIFPLARNGGFAPYHSFAKFIACCKRFVFSFRYDS